MQSKKHIKFNFFGIKFSFKVPGSSQCEKPDFDTQMLKENDIKTDKSVHADIKIDGKGNVISITGINPPSKEPLHFNINIKGNNNKIIIKEARCANMNIDIGNYTSVNNVLIEIGKNLVCAQATILAYQNNVPIKIGNDCLFSSNITIRSGELPHIIYDAVTYESFDNSKGVSIGNHVWVGEGVRILKNAAIPDNSVVGTCSVVTKKFEEPGIVIAGNPAKICKQGIMWDENYKNKPKTLNSSTLSQP